MILQNVEAILIPCKTKITRIIVHIIIPTLIHKKRRFLGAPKATPMAAPRGAPNNNGESRPRPIIPYLFHIFLNIFPLLLSGLSTLFKIRFLIFSPSTMTINAAKMAPNELATPIIIGLRLKTKPAGTAAHSSTIPNKKTPNMDKKYSIGLILLPPLILFKFNQ